PSGVRGAGRAGRAAGGWARPRRGSPGGGAGRASRPAPPASPADVINKLLEALDNYFDPLTGGESRTGWAFGGPIRHTALVRRLFDQVPVLQAVTAVRLVVGGVPFGDWQEGPIGPAGVLWRGGPTVAPDDAGGGSW